MFFSGMGSNPYFNLSLFSKRSKCKFLRSGKSIGRSGKGDDLGLGFIVPILIISHSPSLGVVVPILIVSHSPTLVIQMLPFSDVSVLIPSELIPKELIDLSLRDKLIWVV